MLQIDTKIINALIQLHGHPMNPAAMVPCCVHRGLTSPYRFAFSRWSLRSAWDFGDECGGSSQSFVGCSFGRAGGIWKLHIPAVRRLPLPHGPEVVLPVLSGRSRQVSQAQSVKKLPMTNRASVDSGACRHKKEIYLKKKKKKEISLLPPWKCHLVLTLI